MSLRLQRPTMLLNSDLDWQSCLLSAETSCTLRWGNPLLEGFLLTALLFFAPLAHLSLLVAITDNESGAHMSNLGCEICFAAGSSASQPLEPVSFYAA